jgi:hypothetical protein
MEPTQAEMEEPALLRYPLPLSFSYASLNNVL